MRERSRCWRKKRTKVERNPGVRNAVGEDGRQYIEERVVMMEEIVDVDGVVMVVGRTMSRWTSDFPSGANVT